MSLFFAHNAIFCHIFQQLSRFTLLILWYFLLNMSLYKKHFKSNRV